ncbi:response regulator [Arenibaculum pallidiluteum]|uniref:response regulator n=1 Tax=Arenibaculum pallidiluteum TaxID=2812559 RepID=UPI001A95B23C|nr:response regulator [Arenibaculum pallidiluteum]
MSTTTPRATLRLLIIEDQAILALALEGMLFDLGHEVVGIARDHAEALRLAERHRPDLALVDVMLADGITGIDAMLALRSLFDVPSLFVTGSAREIPDEALRLAVGIVEKPYRETTLRKALVAAEESLDRAAAAEVRQGARRQA